MDASPTVYGVWFRKDSGEGAWMQNTHGEFIHSLSKGEMVAWIREMVMADKQRYTVAAFGEDGFPDKLERAAGA